MSNFQVTRTVTIRSPRGMHLRPWSEFVQIANRFQASSEVICGAEQAPANSVVNLLTLAAGNGSLLQLRAAGPDAAEAIEALAEFLEQLFEDLEGPDSAS